MAHIRIEPHHQEFIDDMNEVLEKHVERVEIDELVAITIQMVSKAVLVVASRTGQGVDTNAVEQLISGNFKMAMQDEGIFPKPH